MPCVPLVTRIGRAAARRAGTPPRCIGRTPRWPGACSTGRDSSPACVRPAPGAQPRLGAEPRASAPACVGGDVGRHHRLDLGGDHRPRPFDRQRGDRCDYLVHSCLLRRSVLGPASRRLRGRRPKRWSAVASTHERGLLSGCRGRAAPSRGRRVRRLFHSSIAAMAARASASRRAERLRRTSAAIRCPSSSACSSGQRGAAVQVTVPRGGVPSARAPAWCSSAR